MEESSAPRERIRCRSCRLFSFFDMSATPTGRLCPLVTRMTPAPPLILRCPMRWRVFTRYRAMLCHVLLSACGFAVHRRRCCASAVTVTTSVHAHVCRHVCCRPPFFRPPCLPRYRLMNMPTPRDIAVPFVADNFRLFSEARYFRRFLFISFFS